MNRAGAVTLLTLAALLVAVPPPADGCGIAPKPGTDVHVTSETAVIVYDAATKTEHFIRTATFNSTSAEFGFLVPTPSQPELAESSALVFSRLADATKPRTVVERRARPQTFGCEGEHVKSFAGVGAPMAMADRAPAAAVQVVEQKRVGGYDAAVLQASDPTKLREWLAEHGYEARPQLDEWFKAYTANGWYMTAFKIAADADGRPAGPLSVSNSAVRISFKTDAPCYPYREPADARTGRGVPNRLLRVYLLSDARMTGTVGNGAGAAAFPWLTVWSNPVDAARRKEVFDAAKLPDTAQADWRLTEFEDRSSPRPGTDEVYFAAAADQAAVERPPNVVVEWYDPPTWPWVLLAGAAPIALLFGGLIVWRMTRKG